MRKSFAKLPSPVLAGVVRQTTTKGAIAQIKNCMYEGAGMIDLHMSCLEDSSQAELEKIITSTDLPVLALNYNHTYQWGNAGLSEEEREESFLRAVAAGAAGVDIQGYTYHVPSKSGFCGEDRYSFTKGQPKEVVTDPAIIEKQCALIEKIHQMGAEVLLSCHPGIYMDAQQVVELALFLQERNPDVIKIVTRAENQQQMLESLKAMVLLKDKVSIPVTYHAAGKAGRLTRVLNPALGGHMAFCVDWFNEGSTMEQADLRTAKGIIEDLRKYL